MSLLTDPNQSRILWHDLKTFPSAANICFETISKGIYGEVPTKMQSIIHELRQAAVNQALQIENLSIIQKNALATLTLTPVTRQAHSDCDAARNFLSPLIDSKKIVITNTLTHELTHNGDSRYSATIWQNILFILVTSANPESSLTISQNNNQIDLKLSQYSPDLASFLQSINQTTEADIYTDVGPVQAQLKLAWVANQYLIQHLNQTLTSIFTPDTFTISYATN